MLSNYFSTIKSIFFIILSSLNLKSAYPIFHHHYPKHAKASNTAYMINTSLNAFNSIQVFFFAAT